MLATNALKSEQRNTTSRTQEPERKPTTTEGTYLIMLNEMYRTDGWFSASALCNKYHTTRAVSPVLAKMGIIKTAPGKGSKWVSAVPPTRGMVHKLMDGINQYVAESQERVKKSQQNLKVYASSFAEGVKKSNNNEDIAYPRTASFTEQDAINKLKNSTNYKYRIIRVETIETEL